MTNAREQSGISTTVSLQDFFHTEVSGVVERHHIDGDSDTVWYLTQLLCTYSDSRRFFDQQDDSTALTPLANYYRMAREASSAWEQRQYLQRLGDVALFISSLFAGALDRKPLNVDYYISMGECAYGTLADGHARHARDRALADIFADLASRFPDYVAALADIPARPTSPDSLMQQVMEWERTRHPALARQLREQGVFLEDDQSSSH